MKPLSLNTYRDVYDATGIDVDGRKHKLAICGKLVSAEINAFVEFSKGLPGFCDLDIDDQLVLIKGEFCESPDLYILETNWFEKSVVLFTCGQSLS